MPPRAFAEEGETEGKDHQAAVGDGSFSLLNALVAADFVRKIWRGVLFSRNAENGGGVRCRQLWRASHRCRLQNHNAESRLKRLQAVASCRLLVQPSRLADFDRRRNLPLRAGKYVAPLCHFFGGWCVVDAVFVQQENRVFLLMTGMDLGLIRCRSSVMTVRIWKWYHAVWKGFRRASGHLLCRQRVASFPFACYRCRVWLSRIWRRWSSICRRCSALVCSDIADDEVAVVRVVDAEAQTCNILPGGVLPECLSAVVASPLLPPRFEFDPSAGMPSSSDDGGFLRVLIFTTAQGRQLPVRNGLWTWQVWAPNVVVGQGGTGDART